MHERVRKYVERLGKDAGSAAGSSDVGALSDTECHARGLRPTLKAPIERAVPAAAAAAAKHELPRAMVRGGARGGPRVSRTRRTRWARAGGTLNGTPRSAARVSDPVLGAGQEQGL